MYLDVSTKARRCTCSLIKENYLEACPMWATLEELRFRRMDLKVRHHICKGKWVQYFYTVSFSAFLLRCTINAKPPKSPQTTKRQRQQKMGKKVPQQHTDIFPPKDNSREKGKNISFQVFVAVESSRVWVHSLWCGLLLFLMITIMGKAENSCENRQE